MMDDYRYRQTRRHFLSASGSAVALTLAGCIGDGTGDDNGDGNSHDEHSHDDGDSHDHDEDDDSHTHDHDSTRELGHPEERIEIEMQTDDGHHFIPHVVHIEAGGSATWIVESGTHDTKAYHPETHGPQQRIPSDVEPWASELLSEEGETFERTFESEGVYDYVCTPHEEVGMIGSIVVGWPDPDSQPGLEPPAEEYSETVTDQLERYNEQVRDVLNNHEQNGH